MITLDVADLVVIAAQVLGTGPEEALAQLDIAAAQAALASAHSSGQHSPTSRLPAPPHPTPRHLPRQPRPPPA